MSIRVAVVDDQTLMRDGFSMILEAQPDVDVVGDADNGRSGVELCRRTRPDVVLMDIRMPEMDGIEATRLISSDKSLDTKVLMLTTFDLDEYVYGAMRAGASGFLGKGVGPVELLDAIRAVAAGDALLSPKATRALLARFSDTGMVGLDVGALDSLTEREREMTALAAHGLSNDEIAERAFLSPLTVKTHLNRAMMKLAVRDRAQLVVLAYRTGLVRPGDSL